jgi:cytochrome P450
MSQDFYPFSLGVRTCIGQQLALIQSKVALIVFLMNFKNGSEVEAPRLKFSLTYGPEKSWIKFEKCDL